MAKSCAAAPLRILLALLLGGLIWVTGVAAAPHISGRPEPRPAQVGVVLTSRPALPAAAMTAPLFYTPPTSLNVILLRVDFPADATSATSGSGEWSDPDYAHNGDSDYWVNKNRTALVDYYREVSRGKLTLSIDISPAVYRLPRNMAAYGSETNAAIENLIVDSVNAAKAAGLDLAPYETIVIVHAGAGEELDIDNNSTADIWSLYYEDNIISRNDNDANPVVTLTDATPVLGAILMPQTGQQDDVTIDPLGVYAHEFGHLLGLPDLYPTDRQSWAGPGEWCLMGSGLYNRADNSAPWGSSPAWPSAWCRYYLGWEEAPLEQPGNDPDLGELTFQAATTPAEAPGQVRLLKVQVTAAAPTQYFLIENRQQAGFDSGLAGHGLLVWKIDESVISSRIALNTVNNNPARPGVALLEADGDAALLSATGVAAAADTLPGALAFPALTPTTTPASTSTALGPGWLNLRFISEAPAGTVSCTAGLGPAAVHFVTASFHQGTVELEWDAVAASDGYHVYRNEMLIETTTDTYATDASALSSDDYAVASVDAAGNETLSLATITATPAASSDGGGGGGGGCFIATAAYGSYEAPAVQTLRIFRDRILLPTAPGRALVATYYQVSPPLADFIATSPLLKWIVRILLLPLIGVALFCIELTVLQQGAVVLLFLSLAVLNGRLISRTRRKTI